MRSPATRAFLAELRRAWPYAAAMALALGTTVIVGAYLSTANPSPDKPFGWPGVAGFENAVAMKRGDLVLATTLPALLLGASIWRAGAMLPLVFAADAALLAAATLVATLVGAVGASDAPGVAYVAFASAHALLALAFYSLAVLAAILARRTAAIPAALTVWMWFTVAHEELIRLRLYRTVGYHGLAAGQFPAWFYPAQAASPLSTYRGVLILWDAKFRDWLEKIALEGAAIPGWLNPGTLAATMLLVWVALPLGAAYAVSRWQARAPKTQATPESA